MNCIQHTTNRLAVIRRMIASHRGNDACLLWPYLRNKDGYGQLTFTGDDGSRVTRGVHRIAFFLTYGHWPSPLCLHRCDIRACFNPCHLFEGTDKDNVHDMMSKGRANFTIAFGRGETHVGAVLTEQQVLSIRASQGVSHRKLAQLYGVTLSA